MDMITRTNKSGRHGNVLVNPEFLSSLTSKIETLSHAIIGFSDMLSWEDSEDERTQLINEINKAGLEVSSLAEEVNQLNGLINANAESETESIGMIVDQITRFAVPFLCDFGMYFRVHLDEGLEKLILENTYPLKKCICRLIRWAANVSTEPEILVNMKADKPEEPELISLNVIFGCEALFHKSSGKDDRESEERLRFFDDEIGVALVKAAVESFGGILTFSVDEQNRNAVFQLDIHPE